MSTDPTGILYYGIKFGEQWPLADEDEEAEYDGPTGYYGISEAWEEEHRPAQPEDKNDYKTPEWDAWRERLREWEATPENIEADWSGTENCQCYYVHAEALEMKVYWNDQEEVPVDLFRPRPEFDEQLKKFCERFKLPYSQPKWHLAARYF